MVVYDGTVVQKSLFTFHWISTLDYPLQFILTHILIHILYHPLFIPPPAPSEAPTQLQMLDVDATDAVVVWKPVDPHSINGPLQGYKVQTCKQFIAKKYKVIQIDVRDMVAYF